MYPNRVPDDGNAETTTKRRTGADEGVHPQQPQQVSIPLRRNRNNIFQAKEGQFQHHCRLRRLNEEQQQQQKQPEQSTTNNNNNNNNNNKSWNWRQRRRREQQQQQQQQQRNLGDHDNNDNDAIGALPLSNCHLVLWTGDVTIGTNPSQPFTLDFDTGSSDIWVPSSQCDATCSSFPRWRKYDSTKSSTYNSQIAAKADNQQQQFVAEYVDGEKVQGLYAQDVLRIGDFVEIQDQVFGEITHLENFQTCSVEEGVFGLAFSMNFHSFPTPLKNLADKLRHPIFSLYLESTEDYPSSSSEDEDTTTIQQQQGGGGGQPDSYGNSEHGFQPATGAHSELVFGGVNQKHYEGCISWHELGQFSLRDGSTFQGYWDFKLDAVLLGDNPLAVSSTLALVDSGSTYVVGPVDAIGYVAEQNQAVCFTVSDEADPALVDCASPFGFDVASIDCQQTTFFEIEFWADGTSYVLGREELVDVVDTSQGPLCLLRLMGNHDIPGWVLGDTFLNKYYSVYDFVNKKVGFAPAARNSKTICERDTPLDLSYQGEPISPPETIERTPNSGIITHHPPGPAPPNAPKPYVPYDANYPSISDDGLQATHKFGIASAFLGVAILYLMFITRRRAGRDVRFTEIQLANIDDNQLGLT